TKTGGSTGSSERNRWAALEQGSDTRGTIPRGGTRLPQAEHHRWRAHQLERAAEAVDGRGEVLRVVFRSPLRRGRPRTSLSGWRERARFGRHAQYNESGSHRP